MSCKEATMAPRTWEKGDANMKAIYISGWTRREDMVDYRPPYQRWSWTTEQIVGVRQNDTVTHIICIERMKK